MRLFETLKSLVFLAGWCALVYMATVEQHPGAGNLLGFLCAVMAVTGFLMLAIQTPIKQGERFLPIWFSTSIRVGLVGVMAWYGWFLCAFAFILMLLCDQVARDRIKTQGEKVP